MNSYDVAVIGGGAAGLSAALVLTRASRRVAIIDAGRPRNAAAAHLHGFLSRDGMPPAELLKVGREEVASYGGELVDDSVAGVTRREDGTFGLDLASGAAMVARRLLVATGLRDEIVDLPGVADRWGRDVLHCPYCHGYEVGDQALGVLGGSPMAVAHALLIRQWSSDVVFFAHTSELTDEQREQLTARAVGIVEGPRRPSRGRARPTHRRRADRRASRPTHRGVRAPVACRQQRLPGPSRRRRWPRGLDRRRRRRRDLRSWRVGAGNAVNPRAQVITAAGEGSAAAIAINSDLTDEDVRYAVEAFRAGLPA